MPRDDSPWRGFARVLQQTPRALLVLLRDGSERWVPQSVVDDDSEVVDDDAHSMGTLVVAGWFAAKEGWPDGDG